MSEELRVKLLGSPAAFIGEEPVSGFVSVKAQALLFYLAATGEAHRRDALAGLLWSDVPDATARKNLRDVLSNLRRLIGPFLLITRQEVGLNPDAPATIDSQVLSGTLSAVRDMGAAAPAPVNALQSLAEVADPHRGKFLDGFYAPDAPLFEEWMLAERARLQWELGNALERLTEYSLAAGDYDGAEAYARRQLELDSYRETAHRQLMTALALSERRAEAVAHYETLADYVWRELGLQPAEKTRELVAQIQAGEMITPAFAVRPEVPPDNLPEALTPFVGRDSELAIIDSQLKAEDCRLLTLHGPGGAGKTRLALEFSRRQRGQYADGIFFVPLASLSSAANLITTIAGAIGLQIRPDREPLKQFLRFLQTRQMLLLLDNFEHLKEGAVLLVDMLQAAPQLTILVTSRERLQLAAESLFEVGGLRTDRANDGTAEKHAEAVQMFESYARRARPEFQADEKEDTAVIDLCRLMEGMPLAIELAAARVFELSPAEILQQIAASSRVLETEYADVPPRLRSVRASFNYSWGLLGDDERQALMRLSVFRGGCTRASAQAVSGANPETLAALVNKSMVTYDPTRGHYHIHEMIRQLAEERLQEDKQDAATNRKHAHFFQSHARKAWDRVNRDDDWEAYYQEITAELANCRAALRRSVTSGDTETALQLATSLAEYLIDHALKEEAVHSLEWALAEDGDLAPAAIRADAYLTLSYARTNLVEGDRKALVEYAEKGLALYQMLKDQEGVARALYYCGYAYAGYDWDRARACLNRSVEAYEDASIEPTDSVALLGVIEIMTVNFEPARALLARRRAIHEKQANKSGAVRSDTWMAFIHFFEGRFDEAQSVAERSLAYRRIHSTEEEWLFALDVLIPIALHKRQLDHARNLLRERLRIMVDYDCFSNAIRCFDEVAEWLFLTGRPRQAVFWLGCFDQAYEWTQTPKEPVVIPHYQRLVSQGRDALGKEAYTAAWEEGFAVPVEDALPLALQVVEQTSPEPGGCEPPSDPFK